MAVLRGPAGSKRDGRRLPLLSLAIASAVALAYEILLTRLFAIIQWHHFAYMIISLALLGYGLSGTVLALARESLTRRFERSYPLCLGLFALALPSCFLLAQSVSLHPEALLWRPALYWRLPLVYLLLAVPFFFIALAVSILLTRFHARAGRIYAADLVGAGVGSVTVIVLLFLLLPQNALWLLGVCAAAATFLSLVELRRPLQPALGVALLALLLPWLVPAEHARIKISPFKSLERTLQVSGAELLATRASPLGLISVVGNPLVPFRHAPGLSLTSQAGVPEQLAVFTDAESLTVINAWSGRPGEGRWLDDSTSALPYHLVAPRRILVADAGGGSDVLRALDRPEAARHPPSVDVLEPNGQLLELLMQDYADFSGGLYLQPGVRVHRRALRAFLSRTAQRYDLLVLPMPGGPGGGSGLSALVEDYRFTAEAFVEYLRHVDTNGFLVASSWIQLPPRDTLRLLATAVAALRTMGVPNPSERLLLIRSWQTATLLVKGSAVTPTDVSATRAFSHERSFDLVLYPGMAAAEANLINRLPQAAFHEGAARLTGDDDKEFISRYKFNIAPASDDRPFFFQFFRWQALPGIMQQRERGGMGMLEAGYIILIVALFQALVVTALLVLLPLAFARPAAPRAPGSWRITVISYFALLGLAFMFLEIAFIQKFLLFLQHPVYAVTVVLATFLVFAGAGSASLGWLLGRWDARVLKGVVAGIMALGLAYLILLPVLHPVLSGMPLLLRVLAAVVLLAPIAFLMGIPFPLGLIRLGAAMSDAVPWAWAINGCASVIGVILATVIAMHLGFTVVVLLALGMYLLCANVAPARATAHATTAGEDRPEKRT